MPAQKTKEKAFSTVSPLIPVPNLINVQLESYRWFCEKGLKDLLNEIFPIKDQSGEAELQFLDYYFDEPRYSENESMKRNISYDAPLRVKLRLVYHPLRQQRDQEVYLGNIPLMTPRGDFMINGVERVVVSQLIRSSGVYFTENIIRDRKHFGAKIIPNRGAWLEFEAESNNVISVRIDRRRKLPVTSLLRAFGLSSDQEIINCFQDVDTDTDNQYIKATLEEDGAKNSDDGFIEIYRRIRPGELATVDNARQLIEAMFFNFERYDLSEVGRWKFNQRLNLDKPIDIKHRVLDLEDLVAVVKEIIKLNNNPMAQGDDIDHLSNRRVKTFGELLQNKLRIGLMRMERIIRDRMTILDLSAALPAQLINPHPFINSLREFFLTSQLSQFMDQTNPLSELEHKRLVSVMGPGGLTRERAGFEVRDVHPSYYGKICPIETPEGPNIGLVNRLAAYARLNKFSFLETPYAVVKNGWVTKEIVYLDAAEEEKVNIAPLTTPLDKNGKIIPAKIESRVKGRVSITKREKIDYIDISPQQCISVATGLIPFLSHDDANRALMGSNMQRQAVPCLKPEIPLVGTGLEEKVARDSGQVIVADNDGEVIEVDATHITIKESNSKRTYQLKNFEKTNQYTCISHHPLVRKGDKVKKGDALADGSATREGKLALGQNLLVAFVPWRGYNFEDAVILSERVVQEDRYTSIHIEDFSCEVRETKLGPEQTTCDIPNVGEEKLKDLDEEGIIRIGAEVGPNDILVGKISPKGEADLTPEERLLKAIFGEKARDVKDTSLRLLHGKRGRVVGVRIFSRDNGDKLPPGVIKSIQVEVAQIKRISVGDKMSGRHGNKGVVSKILPVEDMPHLADGTPVDIILNPLGVVSRMNLGQILETHLGWAADKLKYRAVTPSLSGATEDEIKKELKKAGLPEDGKITLYDGVTGKPFQEKATVGRIYIMKLYHLVEDKVHARSVGPYSLITQQPLGGKARFGGQRFGEMEVWALEGYGAAYALQEMLTVKSDDVIGRANVYDAIIRGKEIKTPSIPSAFLVLVSELKALALDVKMIK